MIDDLDTRRDARREAALDARYYEYTQAADPRVPALPLACFPAALHEDGKSGVVALDLADELGCAWPATSPNLLASFVRIRAGETLDVAARATSQLWFAIRGAGRTRSEHGELAWSAGDLFTLPATGPIEHAADEDSALYWVHDEPLLRYLGAVPGEPRFRATLYPRERTQAELARVAAEPGARERNRNGILLGNAATPATLTLTPTLWSLVNQLPRGVAQRPHRHTSVALDLCIAARPGTYTAVGADLDRDGWIVEPRRVEWQPGAAFVTPPGLWHSHHNESDGDALVLPIQDAGLHTWMRTLDIRFA